MLSYILVMLGGALGTGARFWMSGFIAERGGEFFPLGTLVVNVSGSFVIGFFAAFTDPEGPVLVSPQFRQFFMIGLCGGYTTFSSFSLQTLDFARDGDWLKALLNTCCHSVVASQPYGSGAFCSHAPAKIETTYANSPRRRAAADFYRRKRSPSPSAIVRGDRFEGARDADGRRNGVARPDGIWKIKPFAHGKNSSPVHGPSNRD